MSVRLRAACALIVFGLLSGCAQYGGVTGMLAPDQRDEVLLPTASPDQIPGAETAAFCEVPVAEIYMVMPEQGRVGKLLVTTNDGNRELLEGDYSSAMVQGGGLRTFDGDEEQMQALFGSAVVALPDAPLAVTLYFEFGSEKLTSDSLSVLDRVTEMASRPAAGEIYLVGHTDTVDSRIVNQQLSERRAGHVRDLLVERGIDAARVHVSGRGETQLRVATPDETREAGNRRVEASIR